MITNRFNSKYKTYSLYTLLALVVVFIALWVADAFCDSFHLEYQPMVAFLQVVNSLLQTIVGM